MSTLLKREAHCFQVKCAHGEAGCPVGFCTAKMMQRAQQIPHIITSHTITTQTRKSAQDVLAVFLGVMKDCGYSAEEIKAALRFFAEPKP